MTLSILISFWVSYHFVDYIGEKATPWIPVQDLESIWYHKRQRRPPKEPEVQTIPQEQKVEGCIVTYYDCCVKCCGGTDGITYSGTKAVPYETCAVDPEVIPLGSTVSVDYGGGIIRHYRAEDTGGGIEGKRIDVCVSSHEEALVLGTQEATVYWMEMEALE